MDSSILFYWISILLLLISTIALTWSFYSAIFHPTQWYNPVGKTILLTGCDSGIGFELAKHFHSKGSTVIATVLSLNSPGALKLKSELKSDRFFLVELDLNKLTSSDEDVQKINKILDDNKLELFALVNNAGVLVSGEVDFLTSRQIQSQINVNLMGTILMVKNFLPRIIKSQGRIVNVSSVNALVSFPGFSVYAATKVGLEYFTESLSIEMKRFNVKTVCVRLGDFSSLTNLMSNHERIIEEQRQQLDDEKKCLYSNYFEKYHRVILTEKGMFGPKSYKQSSLFDVFDQAVYVVNPPTHLISAMLTYKLLIYFLYMLPRNLRCKLFNKIIYHKIIKD